MFLSLFAIFWACVNIILLNKVEMDASKIRVASSEDLDPEERKLLTKEEILALDANEKYMPKTPEDALVQMKLINTYVKDGAQTFLKKEYLYLTIFCALFGVILLCCVD